MFVPQQLASLSIPGNFRDWESHDITLTKSGRGCSIWLVRRGEESSMSIEVDILFFWKILIIEMFVFLTRKKHEEWNYGIVGTGDDWRFREEVVFALGSRKWKEHRAKIVRAVMWTVHKRVRSIHESHMSTSFVQPKQQVKWSTTLGKHFGLSAEWWDT